MKKRISKLIIWLLLLSGIGLLSYPFISNYFSQKNQNSVIKNFEKVMKDTRKEDRLAMLEAAKIYNENLIGNVVLTDPFDEAAASGGSSEYEELLNLNGDGMMGYIEIPDVEIRLPIFHGTSDDTLNKGVGHLVNSSLPVGGDGTHAVMSGHTGLVSAKMFNDVVDMKKGTIFLVHIFDEVIAYKVDQIKVVEPTDISDLAIDPDKDYATLVTCTPYGVNTHRLLVRGERTAYKPKMKRVENKKQNRQLQYAYAASLLVGICLLIVYLVRRSMSKNR